MKIFDFKYEKFASIRSNISILKVFNFKRQLSKDDIYRINENELAFLLFDIQLLYEDKEASATDFMLKYMN
jgi:hypothetical protein